MRKRFPAVVINNLGKWCGYVRGRVGEVVCVRGRDGEVVWERGRVGAGEVDGCVRGRAGDGEVDGCVRGRAGDGEVVCERKGWGWGSGWV